MKVSKHKVVSIHYTLKNDGGEVLDSSQGRQPLTYIQGIGNLIPGLEIQIETKGVGDVFKASIAPKDAYGEFSKDMIHVVPRAGFQGNEEELQVGTQVQMETNQGVTIATITKVDGDNVTLDMNHPLAGQTLHFDVEVIAIREASKDEIAHGHVHGPGGHHH